MPEQLTPVGPDGSYERVLFDPGPESPGPVVVSFPGLVVKLLLGVNEGGMSVGLMVRLLLGVNEVGMSVGLVVRLLLGVNEGGMSVGLVPEGEMLGLSELLGSEGRVSDGEGGEDPLFGAGGATISSSTEGRETVGRISGDEVEESPLFDVGKVGKSPPVDEATPSPPRRFEP